MKEKDCQIERQYYSRRDIERMIGCGTSKAYELIKNEIPHIRLGKKILVPKQEFEKWQAEKNLTVKTDTEANAILCHGMRMAEKYSEKYVRQPDFFQLPCDITVMYGIKDLLLEYADMNDWKRFTKKECDIISFRGGHFYYRLKKKAVCDIINSRLEKYK